MPGGTPSKGPWSWLRRQGSEFGRQCLGSQPTFGAAFRFCQFGGDEPGGGRGELLGLVEVADGLVAEVEAAAALSVGEDVSALQGLEVVGHGGEWVRG